jgi:hypothetical protein
VREKENRKKTFHKRRKTISMMNTRTDRKRKERQKERKRVKKKLERE